MKTKTQPLTVTEQFFSPPVPAPAPSMLPVIPVNIDAKAELKNIIAIPDEAKESMFAVVSIVPAKAWKHIALTITCTFAACFLIDGVKKVYKYSQENKVLGQSNREYILANLRLKLEIDRLKKNQLQQPEPHQNEFSSTNPTQNKDVVMADEVSHI